MTKPLRRASKGVQARAGSSWVDRARMLLKPATPMGMMAASAPPVSTASRYPCLMAR